MMKYFLSRWQTTEQKQLLVRQRAQFAFLAPSLVSDWCRKPTRRWTKFSPEVIKSRAFCQILILSPCWQLTSLLFSLVRLQLSDLTQSLRKIPYYRRAAQFIPALARDVISLSHLHGAKCLVSCYNIQSTQYLSRLFLAGPQPISARRDAKQ